MAKKDYYQILGVTKGATEDDIKKAFKKIARKNHPDLNPGNKKAEEVFKEASEAYEVLSNAEKRKKYDTYGTADFDGFPGGGTAGGYNPFGGGGYTSQGNINMDDLGDIFGDIFSGGGMAGFGKAKKRGARRGFEQAFSQKGRDLHFSIELDFLDAINGSEKKIRLPNGSAFNVKIPSGVKEGAKIRLAGKGEPGMNGGEAGDLFIEPKIAPHPYFKREEDNILVDLPITVIEAISGGKVKVPTIDGSVEVKIAPGSQSGQKLRLKGKGLKKLMSSERGDQYLILQIHAPEGLEAKEREALMALLEGHEGDPRKHFWK